MLDGSGISKSVVCISVWRAWWIWSPDILRQTSDVPRQHPARCPTPLFVRWHGPMPVAAGWSPEPGPARTLHKITHLALGVREANNLSPTFNLPSNPDGMLAQHPTSIISQWSKTKNSKTQKVSYYKFPQIHLGANYALKWDAMLFIDFFPPFDQVRISTCFHAGILIGLFMRCNIACNLCIVLLAHLKKYIQTYVRFQGFGVVGCGALPKFSHSGIPKAQLGEYNYGWM